ncbi:unnamed protein product [Auanema sp. JU1783]|nr:unnamed protein product [Auanema sp. JU1783]
MTRSPIHSLYTYIVLQTCVWREGESNRTLKDGQDDLLFGTVRLAPFICGVKGMQKNLVNANGLRKRWYDSRRTQPFNAFVITTMQTFGNKERLIRMYVRLLRGLVH